MKTNLKLILTIFLFSSLFSFGNEKTDSTIIVTNIDGKGFDFEFNFEVGKHYNHPTFVVWIETNDGIFLHPLFVTKSFANGVYKYGAKDNRRWTNGERIYRASLPIFTYKYMEQSPHSKFQMPNKNHPVSDAFSGATPTSSFQLKSKSNSKNIKKFRIYIEINQAWDYNKYWHNNKFPDDKDYKSSCQPSIIYFAEIDIDKPMDEYIFNPIGHGHYSGKDGMIYSDLSTLTTAKEIFKRICVKIKKSE